MICNNTIASSSFVETIFCGCRLNGINPQWVQIPQKKNLWEQVQSISWKYKHWTLCPYFIFVIPFWYNVGQKYHGQGNCSETVQQRWRFSSKNVGGFLESNCKVLVFKKIYVRLEKYQAEETRVFHDLRFLGM